MHWDVIVTIVTANSQLLKWVEKKTSVIIDMVMSFVKRCLFSISEVQESSVSKVFSNLYSF